MSQNLTPVGPHLRNGHGAASRMDPGVARGRAPAPVRRRRRSETFGLPDRTAKRSASHGPLTSGPPTTEEPEVDRPKFDPSRLRRNQILADLLAIIIGFIASLATYAQLRPASFGLRAELFAFILVSIITWLGAMGINKLYAARAIERPSEEFRRLALSGIAGAGSMVAIAFATQYEELSRIWISLAYIGVTTALLIERRIARQIFANLRASGRISRRVAIIGTDAHAIGLFNTAQSSPSLGYEVVGFIGDGDGDLDQRNGHTVLGELDHATQILRQHQCVGAMISLNSVNADQVNRLTRTLTDEGFHVALSTSLRDIDVTRIRPQRLAGQVLLYVEPIIRTGWRRYAKRAFDLIVSSIGILIAAPFIAVAAVLIKLDSPGPVFFSQERVGRDGLKFRMIKLRTMSVDAEAQRGDLLDRNESDGPLFKIRQDPRITRVGRELRKLSIDEFPQFWNVIRGDMSVVGPRPALPSEVDQWDPDLHDRLRVLPGITGVWQVSGRSDTSFEQYKRLDLYYVDNWSLLHDIRIVVKTVGVVLLQRGAT